MLKSFVPDYVCLSNHHNHKATSPNWQCSSVGVSAAIKIRNKELCPIPLMLREGSAMQIFVRGQIFVNAGQSDLFCLLHPVQASQCGYIITCQTNTDYQTDSWNCLPESNAKALHHLSLPDWRILEEDTRAKVLRLPLGDTHWKYRPFWRLSSSANAYRHQGSQQRRKKQKQNSTQCKRNITISAGVLWTFRKEITTRIQDQNTTAIKTQ